MKLEEEIKRELTPNTGEMDNEKEIMEGNGEDISFAQIFFA